jgi:hypothetical protein
MSPVFKLESEYTFKIYSNEEERMHIHMLCGGHEAKYWLAVLRSRKDNKNRETSVL